MNDKELCELFGTTVEKVEAECAKYESGDLSGFVFGGAIDGSAKFEKGRESEHADVRFEQ